MQHRRVTIRLALVLMLNFTTTLAVLTFFSLAISSARGQSSANFTGHWRQNTNSSTQRQLEVEQNQKILLVRTIVTNSQGTRRLEVKYEIGGAPTTYTGFDGDQFRSSVHWEQRTLIFETIENEGGQKIPQKSVWTLLDDGNTLQLDRSVTKSGKTMNSSTAYVRQP